MLAKTPDEWRAEWDRRRRMQDQRDRVRRVPFIDWPNKGVGWCRWCGEMVIDEKKGGQSKRAQWHKPCVRELYLHSRLEQQFNFVEARDGLRCAWPGCGASPERWHSSRIDFVQFECESFPWEGPRVGREYIDQMLTWRHERGVHWIWWEIERRSALQLDHRVPLWFVAHFPDLQRRPYFGPENLWLLCPPHHKAKTRREAAERAAARKIICGKGADGLAFPS